MLQHPGARVGAQQIERADYVRFQSLDPSKLCPALKPGDLALEVRKEVAVQPDAARHAEGSAAPSSSLMCSSRKTRAAVATFKRRLVACARSRRFRSAGSWTLSGPTRFGLTVDFTITTYITSGRRCATAAIP